MKLPKELVTVTPLSIILSGICFVFFVVLAFYLGMQYQQLQDMSKQQLINAQSIAVTQQKPVITSTPTTGPQKLFSVKELGIQFKIPAELNDLIYKINTADGIINAEFTTSSLLSSNKGCTYGYAGNLVKIPKAYFASHPDSFYKESSLKEQTQYTNNTGAARVKKFPEFYIYFLHPQATCSEANKNYPELRYIRIIWDSIKTVELSK